MKLWGATRPATRHSRAWYSEYAICPMCGAFATPHYHGPDAPCDSPAAGGHHNHMRCRCGYEWTLGPRDPEAVR